MKNSKDKLFRSEALERLSSPERLDQLMQVVAPKDWLGLAALAFLLILGLGWSVLGQIPINVTGRGVLINPGLGLETATQPASMVPRSEPIERIKPKSTANLVALSYFALKDGQQIQPGMTVQITPDTVKREQFGGILGKVQSVSRVPVTQQDMINLIGNAEIAKNLSREGGQMQVWVELQPSPTTFSGYQWSSSLGPDAIVTAGITTSVRVTLETQAPITFVFPLLKSPRGMD
jgi:hypothetical protein